MITTNYVKPDMQVFANPTLDKKNKLLRMMVTKVVNDGEIKPELKAFFGKQSFLADYYPICHNVHLRFEDNNAPSLTYMKEKYSFIPEATDMNQRDISELLKEVFIQESITMKMLKDIGSFKNSDIGKLKQFLQEADDILVEMENVQMCSFSDTERMTKVFDRIKDRSDIVTFGNLEAFNRLEMRKKQLVGILAASGCGKSLVLEKLHAVSVNDIVLHFSLELPEDLFIRRIIVALGWVSDDRIEYISKKQIMYYVQKLKDEFPYWHYTCVDTDSAIMNVNKIEKMIKYYKSKYAKEIASGKVFKVFIDYLQILDEQLDPMNCRIADNLHKIAAKNDVCIIVGLQANDEASKYGKPAETSHISFVKSLKNGFDIIQSFYGVNVIGEDGLTKMFSSTKKHRNGKFTEFVYDIDHHKADKNNWLLASTLRAKPNPKIDLVNGTHEDFPEEEIIVVENEAELLFA